MDSERIINVKIVDSLNDLGGTTPTFFACLEGGEDFPLFQYDESYVNFDPTQFIGLSIEEALALKRIKDLIWFQEIL